MVTGDHVEVFREETAPGERRRYTKRFLSTPAGDFRHWTEREWRILARLVGHGISAVPEIVQFDRGAAGRPALVQTYDAGVTVDHWATLLAVERDGVARPHVFDDCAHWWALARHCLAALDAIHELQLVHLDLKADNVCIPAGPADFDPHAPAATLVPLFEQTTLIDFAFSLVTGENLGSALPIARQFEYEYQSPRLLHALDEGSRGNLVPTRQLDWRCDFFSLAAMLLRYLPEPDEALPQGWTAERFAEALAFVHRLAEIHDADRPAQRPHAALIDVAARMLDEPELALSLRRGWKLAPRSAIARDASPTPVTRIALPLVAPEVRQEPRIAEALETAQPPTPDGATPIAATHEPIAAAREPAPTAAEPITIDRSDVERMAAARVTRRSPRARKALIAAGVVAAAALCVPLFGQALRLLQQRGAADRPVATLEPRVARPSAAPTPSPTPSTGTAAPLARASDPAPAAARTAPESTVALVEAPPAPARATAQPPVAPTAAADVATAPVDAPARAAPPTHAAPPTQTGAQAEGRAAPSCRIRAEVARTPRGTTTQVRNGRTSVASAARGASARTAPGALPAVRGRSTRAIRETPVFASAAALHAAQIAAAALHPRRSSEAAPAPVAAAPTPTTVVSASPTTAPIAAPPAATTTSTAAPAPLPAATVPFTPDPAPAPRIASMREPRDFAARARDLIATQIPRTAQRAERLVMRVLFAAAHEDDGSHGQAVRDAASAVRIAPGDPLASIEVSSAEARRLNEAGRAAYWNRQNVEEALAYQTEAFGANPTDPEIVGNLAFLHLKTRPAQPEAARQLALHALAMHDGRYPTGRIEDWTTLAIASALAGRERDARDAWLATLALTPNTERQCRAALNAYAIYGERLRAPVEAMLYKVQTSGRERSALCEWPPHWVAESRVR